jgi:HK97 family phage prohead protease
MTTLFHACGNPVAYGAKAPPAIHSPLRKIRGYAAVFDTVDSQGDRLHAGAIASCHAGGGRCTLPLLWQHRPACRIGYVLQYRVDGYGLWIEAGLYPGGLAHTAWQRIDAKHATGLSIGYQALRYAHDPSSGIRHLQHVRVHEVSVVMLPAHPEATIREIVG